MRAESAPVAAAADLEYLCVDRFLATLVDARALKAAFDLRLVDRLAERGPTPWPELAAWFAGDGRGLRMLVGLLAANAVVEEGPEGIGLSEPFRHALGYRDLLQTKLEYAHFVLPDFTELFTTAISSPDAFFRQARTFKLFCYDRALGGGPEDERLTRRWMRITTCLTKYEAPVCMGRHDFGRYGRMLDVGGNSGEFVMQLCRRHPALSATVVDLPVVCDVGREHVDRHPEGRRITFVKGSALTDALPGGQDLVTFKSMLHDWPEREAGQLIANAAQALTPGGTLLIFERGPVPAGDCSFALIPFLLFFRSFRTPEPYTRQLAALGFRDIAVQTVELEMPFFLVTATK